MAHFGKIGRVVFHRQRKEQTAKKRDYISSHIPRIFNALKKILDLDDRAEKKITSRLMDMLEKSRKM